MTAPYLRKIERARAHGLTCECWDHLRAAGITPARDDAARLRDCIGKSYRADSGRPAGGANR
jgi:hypothetical protein